MTSDQPVNPPFPAMRYGWVLLALSAVTGVVAALLLVLIDRPDQFLPALGGLAVCAAGGLIALELVRRGAKHSMGRLTVMCMAGTSARLGATLLGGLGLIFILGTNVRATASWMLVWYVLLLVVEVRLLARYMSSLTGANAGVGAAKTIDIAESQA
jgi:hypothetical protein